MHERVMTVMTNFGFHSFSVLLLVACSSSLRRFLTFVMEGCFTNDVLDCIMEWECVEEKMT